MIRAMSLTPVIMSQFGGSRIAPRLNWGPGGRRQVAATVEAEDELIEAGGETATRDAFVEADQAGVGGRARYAAGTRWPSLRPALAPPRVSWSIVSRCAPDSCCGASRTAVVATGGSPVGLSS